MNYCLIIDDELPARRLIQMYLEAIPDFEMVASLANSIEGYKYLQENSVDLLFLDIKMPLMTGLELLKSLKNKPKVVLTTAFREYAVEGFELDVLDYLVKPISQERFQKTISKYLHLQEITQSNTHQKSTFEDVYIFLKIGKEQKKIYLNQILYIEGLKDYIKVFTAYEMLIVYERLGFMEAKLPESKFIRVHKSFIVAIDKMITYSNDAIKIGVAEIPIGRIYKQNFISQIEKYKL
ncbi:two component transcriptional regulator, LytTR family (plasmid) [Emticicia oligotrophica DSM 17448]|uniref:Two component transcriptional regulator, LytTR family n=1 Tax=Emticicia oligotrophica (strain DSM 17448 / CIP 109782 / MTCC 6937 / GPTSA100-15) TaxID=929562 RepID=A0ABM5N7N8_EMTOG|nr:response regulator transcription factor [Emticicia oligotrophica]AFK05528.1 two component transcriptional regulator, LytTR family [Emticicia oligotrophica DSM 17448]